MNCNDIRNIVAEAANEYTVKSGRKLSEKGLGECFDRAKAMVKRRTSEPSAEGLRVYLLMILNAMQPGTAGDDGLTEEERRQSYRDTLTMRKQLRQNTLDHVASVLGLPRSAVRVDGDGEIHIKLPKPGESILS